MELVGLLIFSVLFLYSGYNHIVNHAVLSGYTRAALGNCPVGDQLAYLGGWPTGVFLVVFALGTIVNESSVFSYGLAGFLALSGVLFHRNLKDPANIKHLALFGSALIIASHL